MAEEIKNEIAVISEETIREKIYFIRGQKVMLDADLAAIYGYETKNFNRQVRNNADRFAGEDFMFQLTREELDELVRCKNFTSRENFFHGQAGGTRYLPHVFTEQGIYLLMTVLKGDLAVRQSRALVRLFKQMKDYLTETPALSVQNELLRLSLQTAENTRDIQTIKEEMVTKNDLEKFMVNFTDNHIGREFLLLDGMTVESAVAYEKIYQQAKQSIFIVDNYIGIKTLLPLKGIAKNIDVTIFSDNLGKALRKQEVFDFRQEYPALSLHFQKTNNKFHDRFIVLDYKKRTEKIYHCGGSSKDGGKRTTAISRLSDTKLYRPMIDELLQNPVLTLH